MSRLQTLKVFINQRLSAALKDIFGHLETTISEYEAEMDRRHHQLLDVQQLSVVKEEVPPEQQECSSSVDQQEPEAPPHIKEEQEEPWSSQEGEQLQGLEEADITKFPFTPVPVKSEDDEEEAQSSQLHQRQTQHMETEADGEDCGGPEPARNSQPLLKPESEDQTGDCSDPETDDSDDWTETRVQSASTSRSQHMETEADGEDCGGPEPARNSHPLLQPEIEDKASGCSEPETDVNDKDCKPMREPPSALSSLNTNEVPVSDVVSKADKKYFICGECGRRFGRKDSLRRHMRFHTGEKPYSCSVCSKRFSQRPNLIRHMRCHSGEKPFRCSFCDTSFAVRSALVNHMRIHTGEKPFGCVYCDKSFTQKGGLKKHMTVHTGEKPYSCPVCDKSFSQKANLTYHFSVHTGQKQFGCSVCDKRFTWQSQVKSHKCVGESSSS